MPDDPVPPPAPPAAARADRRRARTRGAILDAAEIVFSRSGYGAARIEEIAVLADVSVGSIYGHFNGKRGLYLQLVDRALELFTEYMARSEDPSLSPLQRVLAGGDAYLRFHLEHPGAFSFLAFRSPGAEQLSGDDETEARIRDRVGALLRNYAAQIDNAIAAGEARPVDSLRLAHYLWGAWNGVIALRQQPDGLRITDDEIAQTLELARWLLREGLAAPALRDANGEVGDRVPMPHVT
ncbi:TetR/AcrR family transcriptional regulator [Mycolicibacter hiberniae]|uniref:Putative transcriptional regulator, TetR family protein n=1 Tax=Mycolicibacter hiberniae TaxID=29314 RepID=A0A7I7X1L6_9MYCO|nr:TetR/AcrR family transcriptional regulator [Mycolicibacter hiberniae]MCV7086567.1 TetR/AcrR family transcriptional regulator [Mycolicibacter hiberniae]ORV69937.1 TetR family transcriptional regulator [Mycolicibacter hiberniae]BBZ22148.1 putative transcriptional regulator, TetR family protein [Mycolicibacter hiberniae]